MATANFSFKPENFFNAESFKSWMGQGDYNVEAVTDAARKNMETFSAASREAADVAKSLAQSQVNYAREVMEDASAFWRDWVSSGTNLQDKVEIQNQAARDGLAKAMAHNKELADIWQKSQEKMLRNINDQMAENVSTATRAAAKAGRK